MKGNTRTKICAVVAPIFSIISSIGVNASPLQIEPLSLIQVGHLINFETLSEMRMKAGPLNTPMHALEVSCFATGLYHEARGETREGQLAVAQVILNRMKSSAYPDTACGVIYQNAHMRNRCQFSFACDRRSDGAKNSKIYADLKQIAAQSLRLGQAPFPADSPAVSSEKDLKEITHYHTKAVSPSWGRKIEKIATIGAHIFYRSERVAKSL